MRGRLWYGTIDSIVELARTREGVYRMFSSLYFKELTDEEIRFFASGGLPMLEDLEGSRFETASMSSCLL